MRLTKQQLDSLQDSVWYEVSDYLSNLERKNITARLYIIGERDLSTHVRGIINAALNLIYSTCRHNCSMLTQHETE